MKIQQPSVLIPDQCNNPLAYYVIRCLKKANSKFQINVIVSSDKLSNDNSWLHCYNHSAYVDNLFFSENKIDSVEYLDEVVKIIESKKINIVFPASEEGFKLVSQYRKELSSLCQIIALPSHDDLHTAFDKWSLYLFLKQHNIPVPETFLLTESEQFNQLDYPVLLKPIDGSGGKNIQKLDHFDKENFQFIIDHPDETYIVQDYINGYDIGCNVLCENGQVITYTIQQLLGAEAGFVPKIDKLKFVHDSDVIDVVKKTMSVLKWSGVANLDLRYNSQTGQVNVIEINPRFWQSLMGSLSVGVNFPYLLYLLSNDISFAPISYEDKYYVKAQRFISDIFTGSLEYTLSDTNIKYLLSDLSGTLQFLFYEFLRTRIDPRMSKIFYQKHQNKKTVC
jgi:D-aspartate ligase